MTTPSFTVGIEDAAALGCVDELNAVLEIPQRGTGADHQLGTFEQRTKREADTRQALNAEVDELTGQTVEGL